MIVMRNPNALFTGNIYKSQVWKSEIF
jgi:hypothetical protein